jgi:3-methyladenine DNA glycosylase Tag
VNKAADEKMLQNSAILREKDKVNSMIERTLDG